ncbi:hypothetical protein CPC08DRAFT_727740 [Agrocybe pediades]|nr:hypothetical protein CPC08DRAFT_727740 [Agrocybe pediades]
MLLGDRSPFALNFQHEIAIIENPLPHSLDRWWGLTQKNHDASGLGPESHIIVAHNENLKQKIELTAVGKIHDENITHGLPTSFIMPAAAKTFAVSNKMHEASFSHAGSWEGTGFHRKRCFAEYLYGVCPSVSIQWNREPATRQGWNMEYALIIIPDASREILKNVDEVQ